MAISLYNPRFIEVESGRRVPNTADVKSFVWSHARWDLKVNELKKFPDDVGEALLKHCGFLVAVDKKNIEDIKKQMADKKFKCPHCDFASDYKVALVGHIKTHQNKEASEVQGVEEAVPSGTYQGYNKPQRRLTPEEASGIPSETGAKDKDGIEFYGEGLEVDKP